MMLARSRGTLLELVRSFMGIGVVAAVVVSAACSSTEPTVCNDANCAPGNKCLALGGETKCRKTCSSNTEASQSCPYGYTCTDTLTGAPSFCVAIQAKTAEGKPLERRPGQWGERCQPNQGLENPACDTAQGFYCLAQSPTDANAYCTRYDCTTNEECGPGFWCGKANATPNVASAKRTTIGEVQNVCLRRTYCSPCNVDLDCPTIEGRSQHCVTDVNGAGFCAPECTSTSECGGLPVPIRAKDARCADVGLAAKVCYPRANVCVGDGSLCSPCRVDTDCGEDGICIQGEKTSERSCAKKAAGGDCSACPRTVDSPPQKPIGCSKSGSDLLPAGYCVGLYRVSSAKDPDTGKYYDFDLGCWTPDH